MESLIEQRRRFIYDLYDLHILNGNWPSRSIPIIILFF